MAIIEIPQKTMFSNTETSPNSATYIPVIFDTSIEGPGGTSLDNVSFILRAKLFMHSSITRAYADFYGGFRKFSGVLVSETADFAYGVTDNTSFFPSWHISSNQIQLIVQFTDAAPVISGILYGAIRR